MNQIRFLPHCLLLNLLLNALLCSGQEINSLAYILSHLQRNEENIQLMVGLKPLFMLAREVHNSNASSSVYMQPICHRLWSNTSLHYRSIGMIYRRFFIEALTGMMPAVVTA